MLASERVARLQTIAAMSSEFTVDEIAAWVGRGTTYVNTMQRRFGFARLTRAARWRHRRFAALMARSARG